MVTLEDARKVIAPAERKAKEIEQPMNIAVAGGNLIAHVRMDDAWMRGIDISIKKAFTARAFDISTKDLAALSQSSGQFFGIHASNDSIAWASKRRRRAVKINPPQCSIS